MFDKIVEDMNAKILDQSNSRCPTEDDISIYWLIKEVDRLREILKAATNCLVCASIANPIEAIENTHKILLSGE